MTYFSNSLSCILDVVSVAFPLRLSLMFLPCCINLSLFLSGVCGVSSERSSSPSKEMTGIGSSRFTNASTVNSSMFWVG